MNHSVIICCNFFLFFFSVLIEVVVSQVEVVALIFVSVFLTRPVVLFVFTAVGTEGNSMLLAVITYLRPVNLAWIAELGLASFTFVLSVVILGGLDIVKVGLAGSSHRSNRSVLLNADKPLSRKSISIFFGMCVI